MCLSLNIETTGSKVPYLSLIHARAALRPDVMPVPTRTWPALLPGPKRYPGFDVVLTVFRPFISGSLSFAFMDLI